MGKVINAPALASRRFLFAPCALGKIRVETNNIIGSMSDEGLSGEDWLARHFGGCGIDAIS